MSDAPFSAFLTQTGLFQSLIDQTPLMVLVLDQVGRRVFSSRAGLAFRGQTTEQELGLGWMESLHPDDRSPVSVAVRDAARKHIPFSLRHRVLRADGVYRWISSQGLPWFTPDQMYVGHAAISVDITDQQPLDAGSPEEPRALRRLIENAPDMVYRRRLFPTNTMEYLGGAV